LGIRGCPELQQLTDAVRFLQAFLKFILNESLREIGFKFLQADFRLQFNNKFPIINFLRPDDLRDKN
jgi:hypothetical protein